MEVGWGGWGGVVVRLMAFSFFLSFTFSEGPWGGGALLETGVERRCFEFARMGMSTVGSGRM